MSEYRQHHDDCALIRKGCDCDCNPETIVQDIEWQLLNAQTQIMLLENNLRCARARALKAESEVGRLREALEWYASQEYPWEEMGRVARAALAGEGGEGKAALRELEEPAPGSQEAGD